MISVHDCVEQKSISKYTTRLRNLKEDGLQQQEITHVSQNQEQQEALDKHCLVFVQLLTFLGFDDPLLTVVSY